MDAWNHLDTWQLVAIAATLGFASGLRLYAVLFIVGMAGYAGFVDLPAGLAPLAHPLVLVASGFMCFVEFFADKIPGVDSLWDLVHTLIRIPAGAALAASVFGDSSSATMLAAAILGGTLAAGSHFAKAGSRALINTSPEPFSNWGASLTEDMAVGGLLWLAIAHPLAAAVVIGLLILVAIWMLPKLWRTGRRVAGRLSGVFTSSPAKSGTVRR
ncbi:MAG TPA: DUF4126 domain-containing protein [Casimicrobiaceae bacterium]|nr:DUF4126 domain-containing protein [Casimicrobiaceae bacterium]